MNTLRSQLLLLSGAATALLLTRCAEQTANAPGVVPAQNVNPTPLAQTAADVQPSEPTTVTPSAEASEPQVSACVAADWSPRQLGPLLKRGLEPIQERPDSAGRHDVWFMSECTDAPAGMRQSESLNPVMVDGVEIALNSVVAAGKSGRNWPGNQCSFALRLTDALGSSVTLGAADVPPFTTITSVARRGSALWLSLAFNGYTREFPRGGNRIVALDLCSGAVKWRSPDGMSNGGLLLLGDYLVSSFGFTGEKRYLWVLDARTGSVVQKLPVIENVCPSTSWAPNWTPGTPCDRPGQAVGAATNPRVEGGLLLVDTNTGSSAFAFQ